MDQLPKDEYSILRDYFWKVEVRVPITDNIYVCFECHKVNDDRFLLPRNNRSETPQSEPK